MRKFINRLVNDRKGGVAAEYALIIGLVSLAIVVGAGTLGTNLNTAFTTIATKISTSVK